MTRFIHKKFLIYGAGIIGASVAYQLRKQYPKCNITVCDPLGVVGGIQTTQCSNVLHTGVLSPGRSNRRLYCKAACKKLPKLCEKLNVDKLKIIKIVHAPNNIAKLIDNVMDTNVNVITKCSMENDSSVCYDAWIVDYEKLTKALMPKDIVVRSYINNSIKYDAVFVCAGNNTLKVLRSIGENPQGHLVYIDSMYVVTDLNTNVAHYELTNQNTPFLGKHTTPIVGGGAKIGPNALFSWANFIPGRGFLGRMRFLQKHFRYFYTELRNNNIASFTKWAEKYVLEPYNIIGTKKGTRSVLINDSGELISNDFVYHSSKKPIFACLNTGSPAASTCIQLAEVLVNQFKNYVR